MAAAAAAGATVRPAPTWPGSISPPRLKAPSIIDCLFSFILSFFLTFFFLLLVARTLSATNTQTHTLVSWLVCFFFYIYFYLRFYRQMPLKRVPQQTNYPPAIIDSNPRAAAAATTSIQKKLKIQIENVRFKSVYCQTNERTGRCCQFKRRFVNAKVCCHRHNFLLLLVLLCCRLMAQTKRSVLLALFFFSS